MSIPKEPRQLMINLMYLVLTALLALNVSAEIFNAFRLMDDSLQTSNATVTKANDKLVRAIGQQADAYEQYAVYREKAARVQAASRAFDRTVQALYDTLVAEAGGLDENGLPVQARNTDIATRLLVAEGRGAELLRTIDATQAALLAEVTDSTARAQLAADLPLRVPPLPARAAGKDWSTFTFQKMPVIAALPILRKFQNDAKVAETNVLNHFFNQLSIDEIKPDRLAAVVAADQSYVIRGEPYRSEIFLSAYSSTADNLSISVDGRPLRVVDGKAIFDGATGAVGKRNHTARVKVTNPITGEEEVFTKTFSYEVGERSVTVAADKMNVLYVGVDNPLSISAAGVPSNQLQVTATGVTLERTGTGKYSAKPTRVGEAVITVSGGGLAPTAFTYRIKRIPDPVLYMGNRKGGKISVAEMKVQPGLIPRLEGFDFATRCRIDGFEAVRVRGGEASVQSNRGGSFDGPVKAMLENVKRKDVVYFNNVKARCPGDRAGRDLGGLVFTIK